jgi:hypothetical protein
MPSNADTIKQKKSEEIDSKLAALEESKSRMIAAQAIDIQKIQDEIDELTVLLGALDALDQVVELQTQVDSFVAAGAPRLISDPGRPLPAPEKP